MRRFINVSNLVSIAIIAAVAGTPGSVPSTPVVEEKRVTTTTVDRPRGRFRLLPSTGQKGGQRVDEVEAVKRTERVDRIEPS